MSRYSNKGLNWKRELAEQSEKDWEFLGALSIPCLATIPEKEREQYLPKGEVQRGAEDTMDCASRSVVNILETKFNWLLKNNKLTPINRQWLADNGYITESGISFSDAFVAINSGTTRQGNSLKAPIEAARKQGLIPKHLLPLESNMRWTDYHNPKRITKKMEALGAEFASRFTINYERVWEQDFGTVLADDLLDVAGYAWPRPVNGLYPKVKYQPNHAFMAVKNAFFIFDNYLDTDGDYIKHLARDYDFLDYGYRVYIASEQVKKNNSWYDLWRWLYSFFL